jgi:sRNA-binding protein
MSAGRSKPQAMAVIELLAETFPRCFVVHEARRRPLKIGIHQDILAALDGAVTARELSLALSIYCGNKVYKRRLRPGAVRIGLDGEPAGIVTADQAVTS